MLVPTALMVLAVFNSPYNKNPNYNTAPPATIEAPPVKPGPQPKQPPPTADGVFYPDMLLHDEGVVTIPVETYEDQIINTY
ncbi:MAG: hypothetical protein QNK11_03615 [Legionella sp.]|nr:hypothetical protein [Legionella sp.]